MSYELRTPLTSIGGFAEMLSAGYAGKLAPAASDYVGAILESVARLSKLIDDLLDLTHGDTNDVVLERERIDLGGLCRSVGESQIGPTSEKKQRLEMVIEKSAGFVVGDVRRLRESVEHLMRNAVAYTDEGGHILLRAAGDETEVTITVLDNGPGISPEDQGMVFDRFHRAIGTPHGDAALGLGLPLTRQFVEAHGGRVELVSTLGEGTAVTLFLPRTPPA
jgi:signal transduction histidine kinase